MQTTVWRRRLYHRGRDSLAAPSDIVQGTRNMNVLVINGSPKGARSNTWRLTQAFVDGLRDVWGDELELRSVSTRDVDIAPCRGCFACWRNEAGTCCIHDDMEQVIADRVWADLTIWSFPLYYFSVPGPLKNLIDRQLPMSLPFMEERTDGVGSGSHPGRYDMSGKRTVVVSTCGFYSAEGNYDGVRSLFDHMCGKGEYELIACGQGELFRVEELAERTGAYLDTVRRAGSEYANGMIASDTRRELERLLYPRQTFEAMADASWGISRETGQTEDEAVTFTRQMAALYNPTSFDGTVRVLEMDYTDRGVSCCVVLGPEGSHVVTDGSVKPTTTIHTPFDVWQSIARGEINGSEAMMRHLYSVDGDFDLMLNWGTFFGSSDDEASDVDADAQTTKASRPSSMLATLLPWIVFWTAMESAPTLGPVIALAACAAVPLLFYRNERTPYDVVSPACVIALVAANLLGVSMDVLLPVSYLGFGLLWLVSTMLPVPLSAWYSKNGYGGDKAYRNAIFMRTNRIICMAWGVTYLLAALVVMLAGSKAGMLLILATNLVPIPAAIFTVWFQRWYPVHVARG